MFAKHGFDLGTVTAIQHTSDTGTAKLIKQRMKRTAACFANEKEELLKNMLDAGVIQECIRLGSITCNHTQERRFCMMMH